MDKTYTEDEVIRIREQASIAGYNKGLQDGTQHEAALKAHIVQLDSDLFKLRLKGHGGSVGVDAIVEKADDERKRLLQKIEQLEIANAVLQQTVFTYAPLVALERSLTADEEQQFVTEGKSLLTWGNICVVSYQVMVRYGHGPEDYQIYANTRGWLYFPGTKEDFKKEIGSRIDALMSRAPTREDIKAPTINGLDDDTFSLALLNLAKYYWSPDLQGQYYNYRRDVIFPELIWPKIKDYYNWDEGLNLFSKKVEMAFTTMLNRQADRRGSTPPPPARNRAKKTSRS